MSTFTSEDINNTIRLINQDKRLLDMIMEVDDLFDHLGLYAYKNWPKGKIVEVGRPSKYWINLTLMYERDEMPDPEGGLRLTKKDIKVKFTEDVFVYPKKITKPEDIEVEVKRNRVYRKTKTNEDPVWLVELKIPRKYVEQIEDDYLVDNNEQIDQDAANQGADLTGGLDSNNMELNPTAGDLANDLEI
tara:strand:+ start:158 stop:724 length:567 start_codon:yes stop_codon:yes gene_type:complete